MAALEKLLRQLPGLVDLQNSGTQLSIQIADSLAPAAVNRFVLNGALYSASST